MSKNKASGVFNVFRKAASLLNTDVLIGMGSVFNLQGNYYHDRLAHILSRSDEEEFSRDWEEIGNDMWNAINEYAVKTDLKNV